MFVDSSQAGVVTGVALEGGDRVANFEITDKYAQERLRVGSLRVPAEGRIQINTDAVQGEAKPLPRGARIAATSTVGYWVQKYNQKLHPIWVGGALAVIVVLWLVFKSLMSTIGLILSCVLAGIITL